MSQVPCLGVVRRRVPENSKCHAPERKLGLKGHMPASTLSKDTPFVDIPDGITLAHAIVDTVRDPLLVLDNKLRVIAASRSFYQTFQLSDREVRGRLLYEIDEGQWNIPELRSLLETI